MVTVWCPDWPVTAAEVAPDVPAAVLHANRVVAHTPAAAAEGVHAGQLRRIAQQRCPDLVLLDHDPDRDARAFEPVVRAVGRFAPRLEVVEPGWLGLAARGPSRYFGGDERLAEQLVEATAGAAQVGIADGRFAAAVAARRASDRPVIVTPGGSAAFLAPLPVAWLAEVGELSGLDAELVGLFARLGLARLGDLAALSTGDVLARFGPPGRHAHRLASGSDDRPAGATDPPPERRVEQSFDDPVAQLDPLVFVGKHLADELVAGLAAEGRVCTRLVVTAETEHGERCERAWYRAAGMSVPAMVERVRWQLAGWAASGGGEDPVRHAGRSSAFGGRIEKSWCNQPGGLTGGVVLLRLVPAEVRGDDGDQLGLWGGRSAADERAARAITRLTGLVGDRAVLVPAWQGGRLPGDRYRWVPAATTDLADPDDTAGRLRPTQDDGPWPGALPSPPPAVVLPDARPAELVDADGRPVEVSGRGELSSAPASLAIGGRDPQPVTAWAGPWPLDERWWEPRRHRRLARLQVVTADGAAHLVVSESRRWWVAAAYA
jgi:protein ImuB